MFPWQFLDALHQSLVMHSKFWRADSRRLRMMMVMSMSSVMVMMMVSRSRACLRSICTWWKLQSTEPASWMVCVLVMVMMMVVMCVGMLVMVVMMCRMTSFCSLASL